jgi:glycosyltransferase involved in cell wall biosynthesis
MIAATIVARNYIAYARVLASSFLRHHEGAEFITLVIDGDDSDRAAMRGAGTVALPADLGVDPERWLQMAAVYSVVELATASKPALLKWVITGRPHTPTAVVYLDPDIVVHHPFPEVFAAAERSGIALTPHVLHPMPRDGLEPDERTLMHAGLFNLGFIGVGRRARPFLDWWHERMHLDAVVDPAGALFTDQRWVDWVPSLFGAEVLRDHGLNVAYWNAHERSLSIDEHGILRARGGPLKFFHFSGFELDRPWVFSKYAATRPRCVLSEHPIIAWLCRDYARALAEADFAEQQHVGYGWGAARNGLRLTPLARAAYRFALKEALAVGAPLPPSPFAADGGAAFASWLSEPFGPRGLGLTSWHRHLWRQRPDLQAVFPDPGGSDASRYRAWFDADDNAQAQYTDLHMPEPAEGDAAIESPRLQQRDPGSTSYGWNVVGYHSAELGVGEAGRRIHLAVEGAGIPVEAVSVAAVRSRQEHSVRFDLGHEIVHRRSLYCVNADQLAHAVAATDPHDRSGRGNGRRIALWFWELDQFPDKWMPMFDLVDEVWCASPFTECALAAVAPVPVRFIPLPVWPSAPTPFSRAQLGLPDAFVFLCPFDFHSVFERKNPLGALEAYRRAFGPDDGAALVLKSINGDAHLLELDRLRQAAADRPDVVVADGYVQSRTMVGLIERSDCLVSLHRSEGFGLNLAAAMAAARPVIATGYSGNLAFMDTSSAFLVPYDLIPVGPGHGPYPASAKWADPDLDAAAELMRRVFENPSNAEAVGQCGRQAVLTRNGPERAIPVIRDLLLRDEPWWAGGPTDFPTATLERQSSFT